MRLLSEGVSADNEREVWRQDTGLGPWVGKKEWLSGLRLSRAAFPSRLCASGIQGRTELGNANTLVVIGQGCYGAPRLGSCVFGATQIQRRFSRRDIPRLSTRLLYQLKSSEMIFYSLLEDCSNTILINCKLNPSSVSIAMGCSSPT